LYLVLAIAGLIAIFLVVYITYLTGHRVPTGGWFGLIGFTPFVFWYVIKSQRRHWRRPALWVAVAAFIALHLGLFIPILLKHPDFRMFWFAPLSILEVMVFAGVLMKLFERQAA
jgi:RsiW-degrading membrane proteinase PrsW (M82 family)